MKRENCIAMARLLWSWIKRQELHYFFISGKDVMKECWSALLKQVSEKGRLRRGLG